ncbi:UNVERIFIED_CONTAM: hypothetical protein GTU68_053588 [Idotea baltica]|nr:hypothetical protein [Idotea baltica]
MKLNDDTLFRQQAYINGEWIDADNGETFEVTNPATNEVIGTVPNMGQAETLRAIEGANKAWPAWRAKTMFERSIILEKWLELILENQEDLANLMTLEQGKSLAEATGEIAYGASFIKWFAEESKRVRGDTLPTKNNDQRLIVTKEPIGVCAAITPWNFPNAMITRKAAPALSVGCPMVVKPAEATPYSALALAVLAERAGIPAGIFSIITGDAKAIGGEMTSNPIVRKLTFTGSTGVVEKVEEHIKDAVDKGAKVLVGGKRHELGSSFFYPTILGNVTTDMRVTYEETFGPVAPLFKFKTEEEAVKLANDTEFGLASYFYTRDIGRVWRVSEALEYGMVGVNSGLISNEVAPFGGVKESGLGREGGTYGIEEFLEVKYICMAGLSS